MFLKLAKLAEELKSPLITVELEARTKILKPKDIKFTQNYNLTYYRSTLYPSITFRQINDGQMESKETVEKIKLKDINIVLSVEQKIKRNLNLIKVNTRKVERAIINKSPYTTITKVNDEYTLEVEFDLGTHNQVMDILKQHKSPFWPAVKPMEISSLNLARKLIKTDQWCIAPKADGEHILIYTKNNDEAVIVHDNGKLTDLEGVEQEMIEPDTIYEAELLDNNKLLTYDCFLYKGNDISRLNYLERRKFLPKKSKKVAYQFNDLEGLRIILKYKFDYKTDGFIITNIYNRKLIYKSKFINTVDLRFKNGYLLLENELVAERIPKNTDYKFEEDGIYEFDLEMNLIKERKDKTIANYKFPYDDNPLYKIAYGIGLPSLKCFHNKMKTRLLEFLPKTRLLDIGSATGEDINKWHNLKFEQVYCIDPLLELNEHSKNVLEIKDYARNIPTDIKYNSVSIFFVPWDKDFIKLIEQADYFILICMSHPFDHQSETFTTKIENNKIYLNDQFIENLTDYNEIIGEFIELGWNHIKLLDSLDYGTENEKILSKMYTYHYFERY